MIRFIIWAILIYLFYRLIKSYFPTKVKYENNNNNYSKQSTHEKKEYKIKQEDIIEVDYEEIKEDKKDTE